MNLKLDKMMSKNLNGIIIQIYAILIFYLILQLLKVPRMYGSKLVDIVISVYNATLTCAMITNDFINGGARRSIHPQSF